MQQHDAMFAFYNGKPPTCLSQIKLLAEGTTQHYRKLYESVQKLATSKKNDIATTTELQLKKSLHRDPLRTYRAGKEINYLNIEKTIAGSLLVTEHTLLGMAKKCATFSERQIVLLNKNGI